MSYADYVSAVAERANITKKDAKAVIDAAYGVITDTLAKGEDVKVFPALTFVVKDVAERTCRNPKDGSEIVVPAHQVVKAKLGKAIKDAARA